MRYFILILIVFLCFSGYTQTRVIRGLAFDTTNGRNKITIILNDTVNKFLNNEGSDKSRFRGLMENSKYVIHTSPDGKFKIKAKLTDSLYFESYRHITKHFLVADLLKGKQPVIRLQPQVCEPYIKCVEKPTKMYAFVAEKINVKRVAEKYYCNITRITMDARYESDYKVVHNIYGNYLKDTIKFIANDHYGKPEFSKYKDVLLYVYERCGELIHVKYEFSDVYKTINGRWAVPYHAEDNDLRDSLSSKKPELILFATPVEFDITNMSKKSIEKQYPKPYYKLSDKKATAIYGLYVEDVFDLKKQSLLNRLGISAN
jgi:hypothetical protein